MGGSLGLALRATGATVIGVDPDPGALRAAHEMGAIAAAADLPEATFDARVVFLAAPVGRIPALARAALAGSPADCVVSDLGSVKGGVVADLSAGERERFIGGHPVCGAERTGVAFARADLFRGATWFLTPTAEARPDLFERLHGLVAGLGARPVAIGADVHDRLMALVSHLPHVLAAALVNEAAATAPEGREALRSAGPSFGDLTRVAGANPPLWADILLANRDAVGDALRRLADRLARVARALEAVDGVAHRAYLQAAASSRERLRALEPAPGAAPWRLRVTVPDRPGAISEIATALGHAHINIDDLELRPGPPGGEGELVLRLADATAAAAAARLVAERGYRTASEPV